MPWPFAVGEILTAANLNAATVVNNALCQLAQSATQSISNSTSVEVTFDTEDLDPLAWHSTVTNTHRVTPTIAGWYRATFAIDWGTDDDYTRQLMDVFKNGGDTGPPSRREDQVGGSGARSYLGVAPLIQMNGTTDYLSLRVLQTNTSAAANTVRCRFLVELVFPT